MHVEGDEAQVSDQGELSLVEVDLGGVQLLEDVRDALRLSVGVETSRSGCSVNVTLQIAKRVPARISFVKIVSANRESGPGPTFVSQNRRKTWLYSAISLVSSRVRKRRG